MRPRVLFPVLALLAFTLAACTPDSAAGLPALQLTSITSDQVTTDSRTLTIVGANFFESANTGSMRVEACGVTTSATIIEPLERAILLPPAGKIVVRAGDQLTAELPTEGLVSGVSDVRVIRPDGSSAVLESAVTCVAGGESGPEGPTGPIGPTGSGLSVTLSPNIPAVVTITGPDGYSTTFTGATDLEGLATGEYTLTAANTKLNFEQEYAGTIYAYETNWYPNPPEAVVQIEAGKDTEVELAFLTSPAMIYLNVTGLPADYGEEDLELELERLQADNTWAPANMNDFPAVDAGIYRVSNAAAVSQWQCVGSDCYQETFRAIDGGIFAVSDLGAGVGGHDLEIEYELELATITVEALGLPAGLTQDYYVERRLEEAPFFGPRLDNATVLEPGVYTLVSPRMNSAVWVPHPTDGVIPLNALYETAAIAFAVSSGDAPEFAPEYSLGDGLLRVWIKGYQGDPNAVGNVSFRKYPDGEWTTVTDLGLNLHYVEPGIYELDIQDAPPEPGVHGGYWAQSYPSSTLWEVESYGYGGVMNAVTLDVTYRANTP